MAALLIMKPVKRLPKHAIGLLHTTAIDGLEAHNATRCLLHLCNMMFGSLHCRVCRVSPNGSETSSLSTLHANAQSGNRPFEFARVNSWNGWVIADLLDLKECWWRPVLDCH